MSIHKKEATTTIQTKEKKNNQYVQGRFDCVFDVVVFLLFLLLLVVWLLVVVVSFSCRHCLWRLLPSCGIYCARSCSKRRRQPPPTTSRTSIITDDGSGRQPTISTIQLVVVVGFLLGLFLVIVLVQGQPYRQRRGRERQPIITTNKKRQPPQ